MSTVKVELPPAVTEVGLSDDVAPAGVPLTERLMVSAVPETTAVEMVLVPVALMNAAVPTMRMAADRFPT